MCVGGGEVVKKFFFLDWLNINLKAPEKIHMKMLSAFNSHLLHTFANLIDLFKHRSNQCGPRSDCSCRMPL